MSKEATARSAMKLALGSLVYASSYCDTYDAITALREALAKEQPEQRQARSADTWVGLTDEEIDQGLLRSDYAFKTAEAWRAGVVFAMTKLKEKNTHEDRN